MHTRQGVAVNPHAQSTQRPAIVHNDHTALLRPVHDSAPALALALMRCMDVLRDGADGETLAAALSQGENALRLSRGVSL